MRITRITALGAFATAGNCSTFEPVDFNVTEALIDTGVNVSAIPGLSGLVERSSGACSVAVR